MFSAARAQRLVPNVFLDIVAEPAHRRNGYPYRLSRGNRFSFPGPYFHFRTRVRIASPASSAGVVRAAAATAVPLRRKLSAFGPLEDGDTVRSLLRARHAAARSYDAPARAHALGSHRILRP